MYRFHSNRLGRFLSLDPVQGSAANPQPLNRYSYTLNDPVNRLDPNGLCTIEITCDILSRICVPEYVCSPPVPTPQLPFRREFVIGAVFGAFCRGTTSCDYYYEKCAEASELWIIAYYCIAAPAVCENAPRNRFSNCLRLCLQEKDRCFNSESPQRLLACDVEMHALCAVRCAPCAIF